VKPEPRTAQRRYLVVAVTLIGGSVAGVLIQLLSNVIATVGPSGDGWSFRGNGALIIPFGVGPAVLAAGWTMLILQGRSNPRWVLLGVAAGLLELAILAVGVVALVVGGSEVGASASAIAQPLQLLVMVGAPVVVALLPRPVSLRRRMTLWHFFAAAILPLAVVAGLVIGGFFAT